MRKEDRIAEIFYFIKDNNQHLLGQIQHLLIETNTQRRIIDQQADTISQLWEINRQLNAPKSIQKKETKNTICAN